MLRSTGLASALLLGGLTGCSNSVSDLFQGGRGGAGGAASTHAATTTQTSATGTSATHGATASQGPTANGVTSTSGPSVTTGVTTVATTSNVVSASSGPTQGIPCAFAGTCDASTSVCCYDHFSHSVMCTPPQNCMQGGGQMPTAISCHGPNDCMPGDTCCAVRYFNNDTQPYELTQCQGGCNLPDRVVCDIMNPDCPVYTNNMGQPVQSVCKQSSLLPQGYYVCSSP